MATTRYYYLMMSGCDACESNKPVVDEFCAAHPELKRVDVDLAFEEWHARAWVPKATPTHVLLKKGRKPSIYEGEASRAELETWLARFKETR